MAHMTESKEPKNKLTACKQLKQIRISNSKKPLQAELKKLAASEKGVSAF